MKTVHFDVDGKIKKYLKGIFYSFPLTPLNLKKIPNKEKIKIISLKSQSTIDKKVLKSFPELKLIIARTVGVDNIDLQACRDKHIQVKNIPDYGAANVAEQTLALLLAGARGIVQADKEVHKGRFFYENFLGTSFQGKTLGVVGTGRIGLEFIKLVKNFGMKIICFDVLKNEKAKNDLNFSYVSLDFLMKKSDFISIHVPLLKSTQHLIGEKEIKLMKKYVILVNTARGEIIDEKALIKNVKKFKAVCLDVIENEKSFSRENPLLKYNNIVITPHIAFYTDASIKTIAEKTKEIIKDYLKKNG